MGQVLIDTAKANEDLRVVAGVDKFPDAASHDFPVYSQIDACTENADVIIDFSRPDALDMNLAYAREKNIPLVIATTGFANDGKKTIVEAAKSIPIFMSANMSLGVNLQIELAKTAATFLGESFDIEIIEKHHNQKVDAPSGTALAIAEKINEAFADLKEFVYGRHPESEKRDREIGIHAVRGGTLSGEHDVLFIGKDETIEINHIAQSRQIFAFGALRAARFMIGKRAGLYNMNDIIAQSAVTQIYKEDAQAAVTLSGLPFSPGVVAKIFENIASKNIKLDLISQTSPRDNTIDLSFSMQQADLKMCALILTPYISRQTLLTTRAPLTKLTVEGAGMPYQSGIASKIISALAKNNIGIEIIATTKTQVSICVDADHAADAVSAISDAFSL